MTARVLGERDRHVWLGGALLVGLATLLVLIFSGALRDVLTGGGGRHVVAEFANAGQVRKGDPVRVAGVQVGTVSDVHPLSSRTGAEVDLHLRDDAGPLYADAKAELRFKTVLGGAFSVALDRGSPAAGELRGDRITMARTSGQVEVDDLLQVVRGGARAGLQRLPGELAATLERPRTVRDALSVLDDVAPGVAAGADALRGQAPGYDLPGLVRAGARMMAALDQPAPLQRLMEGSAQTLQTTAARQLDLRRTVARLPSALHETELSVDALDRTLVQANPVLRQLADHAGRVAPAVRDLRPVLARADILLQRAEPLLTQLRPAAGALGRTARNGLPLLRDLLPSLDRLDDVLLPALAEKDAVTEKSTTVMIGGWAAGLGSGAAGTSDINGHFIRFPGTVGSTSTYLPCQTYINNPDFQGQQVQCQSLDEALKTLLGGWPKRSSGRRGR